MPAVKLQAFEERLSDRTIIERRNLLIAACTGLLLHSGLPLAQLLGIDFELSPQKDLRVVSGAFAVAVLYLEIMFILYLWSDHCRYKLAVKLVSISEVYKSIRDLVVGIEQMYKETKTFDENMLNKSRHQGSHYDRIIVGGGRGLQLDQMVAELDMIADDIAGQFHGAVAAERIALRAFRIRHCVLDIGVPLLLGAFCVFKLADDLIPFLLRLVG